MQKLVIQKNEAGQRLDRFLLKFLNQAGSSFIYRMLRKKNIILNGKKAVGSERVVLGDEITLFLSDETFSRLRSEKEAAVCAPKLPVSDIIYEDEDILLINKPAGLLTQKAEAGDVSLNDLLLGYVESKNADSLSSRAFSPSVCNRLDRNTSGIVTAGKSLAGLQFLNGLFQKRAVKKDYYAIVCGNIRKDIRLGLYLQKDDKTNTVRIFEDSRPMSQAVFTGIYPVSQKGDYCLVNLRLETGKPHQLRAVMKHIGFPIIGDPKYGEPGVNQTFKKNAGLKRQLLHAGRIGFPKLENGFSYLSEKSFMAPLPEDFINCLKLLDMESPYV